MSLAPAAYREYRRNASQSIYITDALKLISENTARIGGGSVMKKRWADTVGPNAVQRVADTRPPEEIIADVAEKAGLIITHEHI